MSRKAPAGNTVSVAPHQATVPWMGWAASRWMRLATALMIVGSVCAGIVHNGVPTLATAQSWAIGFGRWAPLVFVLMYAAATVSLLPMTVLSAFAGTLFGIPTGIAVVWCGAMLGSTVAFLLCGGGTRVTAVPSAPPRTWRGFLQRHGTWAIAVTRLFPVVPLGLVNYAFAATSVRLRQYVVGTGIGIVPVTVALVTLGDQATSLQSPTSVVVFSGLAVVLAGGAMLIRHRRPTPPDPQDEDR